MDYLDFELEIEAGTGRDYPVRVINSPAGQARETMHFPFGELELQNQLQAPQIALLRSGGRRRQSLSTEQQTVQDFGRALFDALLTGEVRVRYDVSLRDATLQGCGLRLKLRVNTPEMAALPWEFLYDPRRAEYVCLSHDTPILRYLELPQPIQPLAVTPPLRILGMVASPRNLDALNVDVEKQRVDEALRDLQAEGLVELTWLEGQTWRDLQQAMRRGEWHIFHFIGHGGFDATTDEGLVMLCGPDGTAQRMTATQLGRLLANHRALRLVLLNACEGATGGTRDLFSSTASILVRRGLPAVLAMQYPITDRAAIEFSRTFYESLVDGLPVDAAVVESRVAISLAVNNTVEWGTPVLYMRSPDGVLFKMQEAGSKTDVAAISESRAPDAAPLTIGVQQQTVLIPQSVNPNPQPTTRLPFEPELILIPAGEFLMGSDPQKDKDAYDDEQPQHTVCLPDYYIAKTPVTNAQYAVFVQATDREPPRNWQNGKIPPGKDMHPVINVSWDDAMTYCRWLAEMTGKSYTLPSEAEWEKAARGADGYIYPWGDSFDESRCNSGESGTRDTTPVDRYPQGASPYHVLDMAGNVWEWTRSLFKPYPYSSADEREEAETGARRVIRGGAFLYLKGLVRCAFRYRDDAYLFDGLQGFRVVITMSPPDGVLFGTREEGSREVASKRPKGGSGLPATSSQQPLALPRPPIVGHPSLLARQPFEPELILIPAGEFLMGSDPQKDEGAEDDEQPQHILCLQGYYIAKTPVTNAQYAAFVRATNHQVPEYWQSGKIPSGKNEHPVVCISWDDAIDYCQWLTEVTDKNYTLPSEAEWEKAARGTDGRIYPWGNRFETSRCNSDTTGIGDTTSVDSYPQGASPYKVLDMAGNVWEWTRSLVEPYPYRDVDGREDIQKKGHWVFRGGGFDSNAWATRCAIRLFNGSSYRGIALGFRVAVPPHALESVPP